MNDKTKAISKVIWEHIGRLTWQCCHCPQVLICEEQDNEEPRYCRSLLEAAINEQLTFEQPFKETS